MQKYNSFQQFGIYTIVSIIISIHLPLVAFGVPEINEETGKVLGINSLNTIEYDQIAEDKEKPILEIERIAFKSEENPNYEFIISNEPVELLHLSNYFKISKKPVEYNERFYYRMQIIAPLDSFSQKIVGVDRAGNYSEINIFYNIDEFELEFNNNDNCKDDKRINVITNSIGKYTCLTNESIEKIEIQEFINNNESHFINPIIKTPIEEIIEAANLEGIDININSAHRTSNQQLDIYNKTKNTYGENVANSLSALPGYSEHHLGTAIDFGSNESDGFPSITFGETEAYKWLNENAWKYGFVESYPNMKTSITGYRFEPWHWRYVGKDHTSNIRKLNDITLTEYLYLINNSN